MHKNNDEKRVHKIVKFVHTYLAGHAIIITVKTPQYIIYSFCYTP